MATQINTLDRSLTLWENLFYHCLYFGMGTKPSRRRADELLEQFALTSNAKSMPEDVSGGMAQGVQLARAVAHRPRVLFLDEPTAGLDPQSRIALWEMVRDLHADGLTVLLTTHYMEEADEFCDRVAIIDHGHILVCDTPAALKRSVGAESIMTLSLARSDDDLVPILQRLDGVPVWAIGVEKIVFGAAQSIIAGLLVFPFIYTIPATPVDIEISNWPLMIIVLVLGSLVSGSLGLVLCTVVKPVNIGLMFSATVLPLTFLGCVY